MDVRRPYINTWPTKNRISSDTYDAPLFQEFLIKLGIKLGSSLVV